MSDVLTVFDSVPTLVHAREGVPASVGELPAGTLFVMPAPRHTRGDVNKTVHFKSLKEAGALAWLSDEHMLLLSLAHDLGAFKNI